jgi:hypothetical protein
MQFNSELLERAPLVWLLLGLLMISGGLYLGFDHPLTIGYMVIGGFCSLYGPLLYIFKRREQPRWKSDRPLSRDFISAGSTVVMPVPGNDAGE